MGDDAVNDTDGSEDDREFSIRDSDVIIKEAARRGAQRIRITEGQRKTLGTRRRSA